MLRTIILCISSATLLSPFDAIAQAAPDEELECEVNGYDLIIQNVSDDTFPVGVIIDWTVRFSRSAGAHHVEKPFEPGARIYLTGALEASYLEPGTPCTVAFAEGDVGTMKKKPGATSRI